MALRHDSSATPPGVIEPIQSVIGTVGSGATDDSSEPVKVGGRYNATLPTFTDGQRADLQVDSRGRLIIAGNSSVADATTFGSGMVQVLAGALLFNGSTWDRQRGNLDNVSLISASAATATQNGTDQTNYNHRGVIVVYDATAVTGSGSFTIAIQGKDPVSGKYYALLTGTARSTTGTDVLTVYPGITAAANTAASMVLPRTWRVVATYNSGTNQTFTVSAALIL